MKYINCFRFCNYLSLLKLVCVIGLLLCVVSPVIAIQKAIKSEPDFTSSTLKGVQVNKVKRSICDSARYTKNGYDCVQGGCCNNVCGFIGSGSDSGDYCSGDCAACDGAGHCMLMSGEQGFRSCQRCNGTVSYHVNIADGSQDNEGTNLCTGSCTSCTGSGTCAVYSWSTVGSWSNRCRFTDSAFSMSCNSNNLNDVGYRSSTSSGCGTLTLYSAAYEDGCTLYELKCTRSVS